MNRAVGDVDGLVGGVEDLDRLIVARSFHILAKQQSGLRSGRLRDTLAVLADKAVITGELVSAFAIIVWIGVTNATLIGDRVTAPVPRAVLHAVVVRVRVTHIAIVDNSVTTPVPRAVLHAVVVRVVIANATPVFNRAATTDSIAVDDATTDTVISTEGPIGLAKPQSAAHKTLIASHHDGVASEACDAVGCGSVGVFGLR